MIITGYNEQKTKEVCADSSAEAGEEDGHRHDKGGTGQGLSGAGIQNREVPDRKGQTEKEKLEKRV